MDYQVPSVTLAAQALKLLSRTKYKCCSLKDIARKLDASPTTCLRILRTLEAENFVRFDTETKKYSLGSYLIPLGNRAAECNDSVANAMVEIKKLASITGLTTVLIQRWDDRLVYTASAEPPGERVRLSISVGQPVAMTSGAHGRCFLAYDDESEWRRLVSLGLRPITPASIIDPDRLLEATQAVRRDGYAISHGEITPGFSAVDVPVFSKTGQVELVISCMFVTGQMDESQLADLIDLLVGSSRELSELNGYVARER